MFGPQRADSSFYVMGGTLSPHAPSYVERRADRELIAALREGEFCYVLTSRQMGKSSLMVRTAVKLRAAGTAVAVVDLTALGQNLTVEQWYNGLQAIVGEQLDLEPELERFRHEHEHLGPAQRWFQALARVVLPALDSRSLVLFFDEIDCVRRLAFSSDELFAAIRECYHRRSEDPHLHRLTFCLLGVASPSDLIQDTRTTPFNIGRRVELTDFTLEEARPLAPGMHGDAATQVTSESLARLERVLYWTGGHPYLTQRFCQALSTPVDDTEEPPRPAVLSRASLRRQVDAAAHRLFLSPGAWAQDNNLLFVRERVLHPEGPQNPSELTTELLELYGRVWDSESGWAFRRAPAVPNDRSALVSTLRLAGIVDVREGWVRVRNRIYRQVFDRAWIRASLPDAEQRRQRAAYRRGLVRAGAIGAVLVGVMGGLTTYALYEADKARRLAGDLRRSLARETSLKVQLSAESKQASALAAREKQAKVRERSLRRHAEKQTAEANTQRLASQRHEAAADRAHDASQRQVVQGLLHESERLIAADDHSAALLPLVRALRLDQGRPDREPGHRARIASVLSRLPRPVHVSFYPSPVRHLQLSADGKLLVVGTSRGEVELRDALTNRRLGPRIKVGSVVLNSTLEGRARAAGFLGEARVRLFDLRTGRPGPLIQLRNNPLAAKFSPDGRTIAISDHIGNVQIWDASNGQPTGFHVHLGHASGSFDFSPDGRRVAIGSAGSSAQIWDVGTGKAVSPPLPGNGAVNHVYFSSDGKTLAYMGDGGNALLWSLEGPSRVPPMKHEAGIFHASFGDGTRLVTASADDSAQVWDWSRGLAVGPRLRHEGAVLHASFGPKQERVATAGADLSARVWQAPSGRLAAPILRHAAPVRHALFSPDGRFLHTTSDDGTRRLWDLYPAGPCGTVLGRGRRTLDASFGLGGRVAISLGEDGSVLRHRLAGDQDEAQSLPHDGRVERMTMSPDGSHVASVTLAGKIRIWSLSTGKVVAGWDAESPVAQLAFIEGSLRLLCRARNGAVSAREPGRSKGRMLAPASRSLVCRADGRVFLTLTDGLSVELRRPASPASVTTLPVPAVEVQSAALSADGRHVALQGFDGSLQVWDPRSARKRFGLGTNARIVCYRFDPRGDRLLTADEQGSVQLWDAESGLQLIRPLALKRRPRDVRFDASGERMLVAADGRLHLFAARTGESLGIPLQCDAWIRSAAFSPDGRKVITQLHSGQVRVWDLPNESRPVTNLEDLAGVFGGTRYDPWWNRVPLSPAELRDRWQRALRHSPHEFEPSAESRLAWHTELASRAEHEEDWASAARHLAVLAHRSSGDPRVRERHALALAHLGHWKTAHAEFSAQIDAGEESHTSRYHLAVAALAGGDLRSYQRDCTAILRRYGTSPQRRELELTVWTCALGEPAAGDRAPLLEAALRLDAVEPHDPSVQQTVGAALLRVGKPDEALSRLQRVIRGRKGEGEPLDYFFVALAQERLERQSEAQASFAAAEHLIAERDRRKTATSTWCDRAELRSLRAELLGRLRD